MGNRLYIGNLPFSATTEEVRTAFQPHGSVTDVRLVIDRATGRSRGFAFVTMGSDEEADRAMKKMDGAMLAGRPLRVNEAQDRVMRPPGAGFGGNPSFNSNMAPPPDPFGGGMDRSFGDKPKRRGNARGGSGRDGQKERRRGERW
jgi:RNA recognition motif-containing protein